MSSAHSRQIALELRALARNIENLCRDSRVFSNAWKAVSACSDVLQAEARVIEANAELEEMRARVRTAKRRRRK